MDDREFKLEVLRVTLSYSSMSQQRNILEEAQKNLDWCCAPIDKPVARSAKALAKSELNQDKR
jgi:hypothetical protein